MKSILLDPKVLSPLYVPEKLSDREKELDTLSSFLKNSVNAFVYGSPGSGKTVMAKRVVENSSEPSKARVVYIDCSLYQTTNAIFSEILLSLNSIVSSKSNYELTKKLRSKTRTLDSPSAIYLDHLEHLKELETIARAEPHLDDNRRITRILPKTEPENKGCNNECI